MSEYTNKEYFDMMRVLGLADGSIRSARCLYGERWPKRKLPSYHMIKKISENLLEYGSFHASPIPYADRSLGIQLSTNIQEKILERYKKEPDISIRALGRAFNMNSCTIDHILKLYEEKVSKDNDEDSAEENDRYQPLNNWHKKPRMKYCQWFLENSKNNIVFIDEAVFTRNRFYNVNSKYNSSYPKFALKVWAGFVMGNCQPRILGPYFIKNQDTCYLDRLKSVLENIIDDMPMSFSSDYHIQLDGRIALKERKEVTNYLNSTFGDRWIMDNAICPIPWPTRSPDLTPVEYFVWVEVCKIIYSEVDNENKAKSMIEIKERIKKAFKRVKSNEYVLSRMERNIKRRAKLCIAQKGDRFDSLLMLT